LENNITTYKVAVIYKTGVGIFNPHLPSKSYFKKDEEFRKWILTKCINGERASIQSKEFSTPFYRTRKELLFGFTHL